MRNILMILIGFICLNDSYGQINSQVKIFDEESILIGYNINVYSRFSPKEEEFLIADSLANDYIKQNSSKFTLNGKPIENYKDYFKQVYGLIDKNNNKIIFLNCFCSIESHDYWKDKTVTVKGGGECYFSIKINLKDCKIFDFRINAPL
jgi:hypothetical protein